MVTLSRLAWFVVGAPMLCICLGIVMLGACGEVCARDLLRWYSKLDGGT